MSVIDFVINFAKGLTAGAALFVTGRYDYLEKVTTPRIEVRRS